MVTSTNCPNCGAPVKGRECDYCGSVFDVEDKANKLLVTLDTLSQQMASEKVFRSVMEAMRGYSGNGGEGGGASVYFYADNVPIYTEENE